MELREFLLSENFYIDSAITEVIEKTINNGTRKAFLLKGSAGVGKTQLATLVAKYLNAKLIYYQATYGTSEEDLLYKYVPSENTKSGIKITLGPVPLALKLSQTQRTVLLIDEFDKTRPSSDSLLLDVLQNFRVSLYINEEESIIQGKQENLVVFLTSNDMREFSEPLLRRLIVLYLKPLPTTKVFELLSKKFRKETVLLLTQIYDDTIQAGLRKPATVQELVQLGELIEAEISVPLEDLLKAYVIKYDDDWQKYLQYVSTRQPYLFYQQQKQKNQSASISAYYQVQSSQIELNEEEEEEKKESVQQIVQSLKITVKKAEKKIEKVEEVKDNIEVCAKLEDHDFDAYTSIIKALKPEPSDDPSVLGKFRVVVEDMKTYIVAKEPLTLSEIQKLYEYDKSYHRVNGEFYVEDQIILNYQAVKKLINQASKVCYYTTKSILLEFDDDKVLIEVMKSEGQLFVAQLKMYVKCYKCLDALEYAISNTDVIAIANRRANYGTISCSDSVSAAEVLSLIKLLRLQFNTRLKQNYNIVVDHATNEFNIAYTLRDKIIKVLRREPATTEDVIKALEVIVNEQNPSKETF